MSWLILDGPLVVELDSVGIDSFKSLLDQRYDIMPGHDWHIDIKQYERNRLVVLSLANVILIKLNEYLVDSVHHFLSITEDRQVRMYAHVFEVHLERLLTDVLVICVYHLALLVRSADAFALSQYADELDQVLTVLNGLLLIQLNNQFRPV